MGVRGIPDSELKYSLKVVVASLNGTVRIHSSAVLITNKGWKLGSPRRGRDPRERVELELDMRSRNIQSP